MGSEGDAILDPAALDGLREIGGDEFLADLVATFLADAPPMLAALRGANAEEVRRAAHTLKSNRRHLRRNALLRAVPRARRTGERR
jgi:HPt (histidine-containing phosphotransfer) domain-containing protein